MDDEWVRYEGELRSDAKEGKGKLILTNGEEYEGEFSKDMVHGVGVFRSGGTEKKGIWENGKLKKLVEVASLLKKHNNSSIYDTHVKHSFI